MVVSGRLFIVSAPSGAGKTTVVNAVLERMRPDCAIERLVTYTTKKPRAGETIDGVDYHFVTNDDFQVKIKQGFFL